jgi:hypothetical protein
VYRRRRPGCLALVQYRHRSQLLRLNFSHVVFVLLSSCVGRKVAEKYVGELGCRLYTLSLFLMVRHHVMKMSNGLAVACYVSRKVRYTWLKIKFEYITKA